jgi:hypothetical protein
MVRKARNSISRARGTPATAIAYRGGIRNGVENANTDLITVNLSTAYSQSSTGAGLIANVWKTDDVTASSDFASYAATYTEYRVLGFEVEWVPLYGESVTTPAPGIGAQAIDRSNAIGTPASLDAVIQRVSWKTWKTNKPNKMHWKMSSVEEATFTNTSATVTHGGVVNYVGSLTPSTVYGNWYVTFKVQFRNRK